MSRCGCSSAAASGVSWIDTDTINVTGAGTPASPFAPDVEISADARNLVEAHADGLYVPDLFDEDVIGYTPAWTGSSSNPTIGNGQIIGKYKSMGKLLFLRIFLSVGSTTTLGSGTYAFGLPPGFTADVDAGFVDQVLAAAVEVGLVTVPARARVDGTSIQVYSSDNSPDTAAQALLTDSYPAAWFLGDKVMIQGTLQVA